MLRNELYTADAVSYDTIAVNLLNGEGFVYNGLYARRGPIYPLFLAFIYLSFGHSYVAIRFAQAIIGALTCIIIYLLGKQIFDKKVGLVAAFISAVYYPFILQPAYLLPEVFFTFLLALTMFFFVVYYNSKKYPNLFTASIILGISSLCKTVILPFALFLIVWIIFIEKFRLKYTLLSIGILFLGLIITISPWSIRNYKIYKSFIPITIESGRILYLGNNPLATGGTGGWYSYEIDAFLPQDVSNYHSLESDRIMFKRAIAYIKTHPKRIVILAGKKMINMWGRPFYSNARLINKIIMSLNYVPLILLSLFGIIKSCKYWRKLIIIYFIVGYFIIVHMITISIIRYRYPVMLYLILLAAFPLAALSSKLEKHRSSIINMER
jgi:4-amino-4-deoxy-L-arabinose transferase-like glycosyltransferase